MDTTFKPEKIVVEASKITMGCIYFLFLAEKIVFEDVRYDEKFYITVGAAIIAAILVGVFVMHAIVSYCEGRRLYTKGFSYLSCFDYLPILNSA